MGKKGRDRRKKRKISSESDNNESIFKAGRFTESPKGFVEGASVSEILSQTNQVLFSADEGADDIFFGGLFEENSDDICLQYTRDNHTSTVSTNPPSRPSHSDLPVQVKTDMATGTSSDLRDQSHSDIMSCLRQIQEKMTSIDNRLGSVESKLKSLESLERKVDGFDREMKKLWNFVQDSNKKSSERISHLEEKVESADFSVGLVNDKIVHLEREKESLKEDVVYLKSQSMRNNLLFQNIPEARQGVAEDCESVVKTFIHEKMKVAKEIVDNIVMDRVHRIGVKTEGRCRKIVARFRDFKEREFVRKQWKTLEGTPFNVHEQFPPEVIEKRKKLFPKLREAKQQNKRAWISYDTLYIDGKPVRD